MKKEDAFKTIGKIEIKNQLGTEGNIAQNRVKRFIRSGTQTTDSTSSNRELKKFFKSKNVNEGTSNPFNSIIEPIKEKKDVDEEKDEVISQFIRDLSHDDAKPVKDL